jgi:hypothetical protein
MSTHIVDRILAVKLPKERTASYDDCFIVAQLGGDNNVINCRTNRRARHWHATAIGPDWSVIGEACRYAAGCSGGMLKLYGRATEPETYIRAYRKAIQGAVIGLREAASVHGLRIQGWLLFNEADKLNGGKWAWESLAQLRQPGIYDAGYCQYTAFRFDLENPEDFQVWSRYRYGPAWYGAEVHGPGEE